MKKERNYRNAQDFFMIRTVINVIHAIIHEKGKKLS